MSNKEKELIKQHEGYRQDLYLDTKSIITGGYGHAFHVGSILPRFVWEQIFDYDYANDCRDYAALSLNLDSARKAVIIDMLHNLGYPKLLKFSNMLSAIKAGNWQLAHDEMKNSKWHDDVKGRAITLEHMMLTGRWPDEE